VICKSFKKLRLSIDAEEEEEEEALVSRAVLTPFFCLNQKLKINFIN
jgi:hypothetical protein